MLKQYVVLIFVAVSILAGPAVAQKKYESKADAALQLLEQIEEVAKINSEMARILESDERIEPSVLANIYQRLELVDKGPAEYCCHNDGTCDCDNFWDCLSMTWACKSGTTECDGDKCSCTEDGPTHCPFENCCTSVGTRPNVFSAGN